MQVLKLDHVLHACEIEQSKARARGAEMVQTGERESEEAVGESGEGK